LYRRKKLKYIEQFLPSKQIIAITGLRRVGKTVMMKQLVHPILLETPKCVFYFLFDDLLTQNPDFLEDLLNYYLKTIANQIDEKKYILLDEIQKVLGWTSILKRFYDTRDDIKFIISGSSSLKINISKESLAGRIYEIYLPVLSFREFIELNGDQDLQSSLSNLNFIQSPNSFEDLKKGYENIIHRKELFEELLLDYLYQGAFPEVATEKNLELVSAYHKDAIIDHVLLGDIPLAYGIKRKDVLFSLFQYCGKETSNLIELANLATILNVNYQTIKEYLAYLEESYLITLLFNYSGSFSTQLRLNKKVHIIHPALTMTLMHYPKDILAVEEICSKMMESLILPHVKLIADRVAFWRSPQKEEVDFILENPLISFSPKPLLKSLLPIELKYRERIDANDFKGLKKCMKKYGLEYAIMLTKNRLEMCVIDDFTFALIPVWLFLLWIS
jgi:hypothetical protein